LIAYGDVVVELVEVRTAVRRLERNEVRDDRDLVRRCRADERIQVGVVGERILADERRFAVAGRADRTRAAAPMAATPRHAIAMSFVRVIVSLLQH
jgi:hypothetical protein